MLTEANGDALESVLGVTNALHRRKLLRALTVRLVGVASRTLLLLGLCWC